jgi:FAD/FMN-containing dehydrogenase
MNLSEIYGSTLAYGNGRSYGDSCLATSNHVLRMRPLSRFIKTDWVNGIVVAESGVTLDEILRLAVPNGWFLPVTPGTKFVTLGGAIANDVHGKNHHAKSTFGCHVRKFGIVRSDKGSLTCSCESNSELFSATIGGLGLTGIIDWVELKLMPVKSSYIEVTHIRFDSLEEFFSLSQELDNSHEYSVAWIDCLATGESLGRGIYIVGNHTEEGELKIDTKKKINVPITPPISLINRATLRLFNTFYYKSHNTGRHKSRVSYEPFFYPLDRVRNWNRIYGSRGFQQYQCVLPEDGAIISTKKLLDAIAKEGMGSFLAVLKYFGNIKSPGMLSFPMPGITLALDFPERGEITSNLFRKLDNIVREIGGRLYPAKDAHMCGEDFRTAYPAWEKLEELRDPTLSSHFWKRVTAT